MKSRSTVIVSTCYWIRWIWLLTIAMAILAPLMVLGQETTTTPPSYSDQDLEVMTDAELEKICRDRGFELVTDEVDAQTGQVYQLSHKDYVEAAQRCLVIEQEMNELLEQYPELADELEEEMKKMEEEKEDKKAEIAELQKQLDDAERKQESVSSEEDRRAFVPPATTQQVDAAGNDGQAVSSESKVPPAEETPATQDSATVPDDDAGEGSSESTETTQQQQEEQRQSVSTTDDDNNSKEDFTVRALSFEIFRKLIQQGQSDLKRILELISPIVRPLIQAGDKAWRRLRTVVVMTLKNYEMSKNSQEEAGESCPEEAAS